MRQSNVALNADQVKFCRESLRKMAFGGYFHVNWAGSAGSGRQFFRLTLNRRTSVVYMLWHGTDRDWDYFYAMQQLRVRNELQMLPGMLAHDREQGMLLVEDGGDRRLKDLMFSGVSEKKKIILMTTVIEQLLKWQDSDVPENSIIAQRALDRDQFLWETSYFEEHLGDIIPEIQELFNDEWKSERELLAELCDSLPRTLLHRDFQSENICFKENRVTFVDFQGARMGPPEYDLASLIYDPYIQPIVSDEVRESAFGYYRNRHSITRENFYLCAAQRLMQALGAYGNLSSNKGKKQYRRFVEPALINLVSVTNNLETFPQIRKIASVALEAWRNR